MNAMEKVAWTELMVSLAAVVAVALLFPWLGDAAIGAFGLLGLMGLAVLFLRRRGNRVVVDERDHQIALRATAVGVYTSWMAVNLTLIAAVVWSGYAEADTVPTRLLHWLLWLQFAFCIGLRGLVSIALYRRQHAA
jgi:hypothetical protein